MGKTSKWIKHLLIGKKDKDKEKNNNIGTNAQGDQTLVVNGLPTTKITVQPMQQGKEKRRWSFRRSSTTAPPSQQPQEQETEHIKKAMEMAIAAEMELSNTALQRVKAIQESTAINIQSFYAIQESAAIKIQSFYRGYLSRKALNALRGLVKLQALVRGHLVRKQAAATLRCMQSLIKVQSRARAQRLHVVEKSKSYNNNQKPFNQRNLSYDFRSHSFQDLETAMEENVKIVEMDPGDAKPNMRSRTRHSSHGNGQMYPFDHIISSHKTSTKHDQEIPPSQSPSARTENSVHFGDHSFSTAQSSPQKSSRTQTSHAESIYREYPQFYPSYMANTQSSQAKARSQSAPKSRLETYERQNSGRRRNVPRGVAMQRSSSHVAAGKNYHYQYPGSIRLNKSYVSFKDSECGSNSTVFTVY